MDGVAIIALGLLAYGSLHIETPGFRPWQWLNAIFGIITLIASVLFWSGLRVLSMCATLTYVSHWMNRFFFPDNPTTAWFLSPDERVVAVTRIRQNQTGLENKRFKKAQYVVKPFSIICAPTLPLNTENLNS